MMQYIVEQVLAYGRTQPDKTALTDGKKSLTFGELASSISFVAVILQEEYKLKKQEQKDVGCKIDQLKLSISSIKLNILN